MLIIEILTTIFLPIVSLLLLYIIYLFITGKITFKNLLTFLRSFALTLAIMILIPMISYWGIQTWQPDPLVNESFYPNLNILSKKLAQLDNTISRSETTARQKILENFYQERIEIKQQYQQELEIIEKKYDLIYFIVASIIAFLSIIAGLFISLPELGAGFIIGGLSCFSMGYIHYWNRFGAAFRLSSLILILLAITIFGYIVSRKEK